MAAILQIPFMLSLKKCIKQDRSITFQPMTAEMNHNADFLNNFIAFTLFTGNKKSGRLAALILNSRCFY